MESAVFQAISDLSPSTESEDVNESIYSITQVPADDSIICLDDDSSMSSRHSLPNELDTVSCLNEVEINDNEDDDFSIVYEKIMPPAEVQFVVASNSLNLLTLQGSQTDPNDQIQSQQDKPSLNQNPTPERDTNDDSIRIVGVYGAPRPPVIVPLPNAQIAQKSKNVEVFQRTLLDSSERKKRKIECAVCFDGPDEITNNGRTVISTVCGHIFCDECIKQAIKAAKQCPQCRKRLNTKQFHPIYI